MDGAQPDEFLDLRPKGNSFAEEAGNAPGNRRSRRSIQFPESLAPYPYDPARNGGKGKRTYFQAHPEWFGMRNGKRIGDVGGWSKEGRNICTSNDEAVAELSKNFVQGLIDGVWRYADVVNFWMLDGSGKWCDCENCKALGSYSDRIMRLVYQVNKEVQKARKDGRLKRNVHLTTLAYSDTLAPPTRPLPMDFDYENCSVTFYPIQRCYVHAMNDPNCTEINRGYAEAYLGMGSAQRRLLSGNAVCRRVLQRQQLQVDACFIYPDYGGGYPVVLPDGCAGICSICTRSRKGGEPGR